MAETTIDNRRISGTGQLQLSPAQLQYRRYSLFADIIRKPRTPYFNRKYEPPQTFYAYISLMKLGYCLKTFPMKYDAQIWSFEPDICGQALIATKCEYLGVLQSFANLGTALGLTVTSVENTIDAYSFLPLQWDSIIVKCYADTAIQLVLSGLPYDVCQDRYLSPVAGPFAPIKPTQISPGTATQISPPYPQDTITNPADIDKTYVPPAQGTACVPGVLTFTINYELFGTPSTTTRSLNVYGQVGNSGRSVTPGVAQIQYQGLVSQGGCQTFDWRDVESLGPFANITSVTGITFV